MFQSPIHYCRPRKVWVALDQSVEQCRALHKCPPGPCPYRELFAAVAAERKLLAEAGRRVAVTRCAAM